MENLAHTLLGLSFAKAGLERVTPLATTALVISSNLPDIDVLLRLEGGTVSYLKHHRGFTHGFLDGVNHQGLVHARFPKSRGVRVGTVVGTTPRGVLVKLEDGRGDGKRAAHGFAVQSIWPGTTNFIKQFHSSFLVTTKRQPSGRW